MNTCRNCAKLLPESTGGRKRHYCNDACRMAYKRKSEQSKTNKVESEQVSPEGLTVSWDRSVISLEHYKANPDKYAQRTHPDRLNWGVLMTASELNKAGLSANRVTIPGDFDYVPPKGE